MSESSPYEKETRKFIALGLPSWLGWRDLHRSRLKDVERVLKDLLDDNSADTATAVVKRFL